MLTVLSLVLLLREVLGTFQQVLLVKSISVQFTQEIVIENQLCGRHSKYGVCVHGIRQILCLHAADIRGGIKITDKHYVAEVISKGDKDYKENKTKENVIVSD